MDNNVRFDSKKNNFMKAFQSLKESLEIPITTKRDLSGIIKDFELLYELSWKVLKLHLELAGHQTNNARHAFSVAYQLGLLKDENVWLQIIKDRNMTVHTYDEKFAREMVKRIETLYFKAFESLVTIW
jgi:nucleotidyltransferase substrate binding protein (TIGR01987 family)